MGTGAIWGGDSPWRRLPVGESPIVAGNDRLNLGNRGKEEENWAFLLDESKICSRFMERGDKGEGRPSGKTCRIGFTAPKPSPYPSRSKLDGYDKDRWLPRKAGGVGGLTMALKMLVQSMGELPPRERIRRKNKTKNVWKRGEVISK